MRRTRQKGKNKFADWKCWVVCASVRVCICLQMEKWKINKWSNYARRYGIWTQYFLEATNLAAIYFDGRIMVNLLAMSICHRVSGGYDWDSLTRLLHMCYWTEVEVLDEREQKWKIKAEKSVKVSPRWWFNEFAIKTKRWFAFCHSVKHQQSHTTWITFKCKCKCKYTWNDFSIRDTLVRNSIHRFQCVNDCCHPFALPFNGKLKWKCAFPALLCFCLERTHSPSGKNWLDCDLIELKD